ncbi:MAG: hypothetical protein JW894_05640 [Bacteroidales bacterium]|nr:hypothetical protein [Bacteroidales bacterium]
MKNIFISILFTIILTLPLSLKGQDCTDYHQYHCLYADYTFFYSRQSKSALFKRGQTSELKIIAYSGEDYYVSVCAHRKFGNVRFRILEDNDQRMVIYDNAENDYAESVTFSNDITRNLIIEVSVLETEDKSNDRRCVGVVIQFRKTEIEGNKRGKLGF